MYFFKHETGRFYDSEQILTILVRDNETYDDNFLKHDITFRDASRNIVGYINFETSEDREDWFTLICPTIEKQGAWVQRQYDQGEYMTGGHVELDQIRYYYARYA